MSAHQIHRMIGVSYKTAWFMCHRIREGLREGKFPGPLGGENKVVEADETYVGGKETNKHKSKRTAGQQGGKGKEAVFSLVERDGKVRSRHVPEVTAKTLREAIVTQVDRKSHLMTDEAGVYTKTGEEFAGHSTVNHSIEEYVRHGGFTHTNTRSKAISRSSSAACTAPITTSRRLISSATSANSTSVTTSAQPSK
jgi:hypothetical protein